MSMKAPLPANESKRLAALREYRILDTAPEQIYDDLTRLAAHICGVPIATISLVDEARQWFKSKLGLRAQATTRDIAFCAHAIGQPEPLVVPDAIKDKRFFDNPLVVRAPGVRFYAGFPLTSGGGYALGALCAIDRKPRRLSPEQRRAMEALARQVMALLELRRVTNQLAHSLKHVKILQGLLPICAWCKRIRDDQGYWSQIEKYVRANSEADFTHSICPECLEKQRPKTTPASQADTWP